MITAAQAKEKTMERITQIAKEFIIKCIEPAIDEAIKEGKFLASAPLDVVNSEIVGEEVVKLLKQDGYYAEHTYYDNYNGYANYILVKWED